MIERIPTWLLILIAAALLAWAAWITFAPDASAQGPQCEDLWCYGYDWSPPYLLGVSLGHGGSFCLWSDGYAARPVGLNLYGAHECVR